MLAAVLYGLFHYEYTRLQEVDETAYEDENVVAVTEEAEQSEVMQQAREEMEEQLQDLEETEVVEAWGEIFEDDDVYNILLIGTDDRTVRFSENARGDTCMLLSLNRRTGLINLISFERGMGVQIPWGVYQGQWDWLTQTFVYGGAEMMLYEIRENFKVDVDRYVRINIRTLIKLVDAIGGVDVDITAEEAEHINHPEGTFTADHAKSLGVQDEMIELHEGIHHLNGATAMVYARTRYIDDDWHRVKRQRNIIVAAKESLGRLNPVELAAMIDAVIPLVQTNLTESEIADLLAMAPKFLHAELEQMTIPVAKTYGSMIGMAGRGLFAVDFATNAEILREQLYGIADYSADPASLKREGKDIEEGGPGAEASLAAFTDAGIPAGTMEGKTYHRENYGAASSGVQVEAASGYTGTGQTQTRRNTQTQTAAAPAQTPARTQAPAPAAGTPAASDVTAEVIIDDAGNIVGTVTTGTADDKTIAVIQDVQGNILSTQVIDTAGNIVSQTTPEQEAAAA